MKKMSEVLEALAQRWDAPLKQVDGFDYIPWEATVSHMNEVFGPLGWSHGVVTLSLDEQEVPVNVGDRTNPRYEMRTFMGYSSVVPVEVQVFDDVHGTGQIIKASHAGVGFGPIIGQGNKNPLDNAAKTAKSDGISTAAKHFGDAFGLYLYRKEAPTSGGSSGTPRTTSGSSGGGKGKPTAKQLEWLQKKGLPQNIIDGLNFEEGKAALDALFAGDTPQSVVEDILHLTWEAPAKAKDGLPLPAGRR